MYVSCELHWRTLNDSDLFHSGRREQVYRFTSLNFSIASADKLSLLFVLMFFFFLRSPMWLALNLSPYLSRNTKFLFDS